MRRFPQKRRYVVNVEQPAGRFKRQQDIISRTQYPAPESLRLVRSCRFPRSLLFQLRSSQDEIKQQPILIHFRAVYVFDVLQTEGADPPEFEHDISGDVGAHRDRLISFLGAQNIALENSENVVPHSA